MPFHNKLTALLKTDPRFLDDEGELIFAAAYDRAWKLDRDLVNLLLSDAEITARFFQETEGLWIFTTNLFIDCISHKKFLENSYSRFRNRIGLTIGGKYLRERGGRLAPQVVRQSLRDRRCAIQKAFYGEQP
jgi:adenine-specific DNA-methyltransferase